MSTLSSRTRRGGFTLVEVAIALVIFVFGALAIVQIFPPALGVIRNNEGRVAGTQLGETLLARTAGKPISLPDAIYEGSSNTWNDLAMAVVGTPGKNKSLPAGPLPADFANSALGKFTYISGERHTVRTDGTYKWVFLNHSAAMMNVWIDQEEEIQGVQIDDDGKLNFTYATDSAGQPFTSMAPAQAGNPPDNKDADNEVLYYVSYKWRDTSGHINGVIDEPLSLPDGIWTGNAGKVLQGILASNNHIIPGAIKVRYRQRLGTTSLLDPAATSGFYDVSGNNVLDTNGNPVNLTAGKTYSFSYTVSDWRWMMDDRAAPSPSGVVQLPIKNLDNQPVGSLPSVLGLKVKIGDSTAPVADPFTIDYKEGTVTYPPPSPPVSGFRYRTVYRALDGWAQQLSVAAKSYIPFYPTRPAESPREAYREYYWLTGTSDTLYFHASEAGKSVVVSYEYDDSGTSRTITGAVLTINDDLIPQPTSIPSAFVPSGKIATAIITDLAGNPISNVTAIRSVQGLSVHARTAWQNADRYNQVIVPAYRTLMQ